MSQQTTYPDMMTIEHCEGALMLGNATASEQIAAARHLAALQDKLAQQPASAVPDDETNQERAARIVASWPEWKREVMLTKYSATAQAEKGRGDA